MNADPSVYNSSPREMKKVEKRYSSSSRRTIKFIMFAFYIPGS